MCKWRIKFRILITLEVMYSSKLTVSLRTRAKPWPEERCSSVLVDVINGIEWGGVGLGGWGFGGWVVGGGCALGTTEYQ